MTTETVCIPAEEYRLLVAKAKIADDAVVQLKLSLEDLRNRK